MTAPTPLQRDLRRLLAAFDDDALATLANKGLLRRAAKDLEKAVPAIAEETPDALVMAVGEHRVRIDRGGPAQAKCTCPATTTCQHVLTALLALQRSPIDAEGEDLASHAPAESAPDAAALHDALMALDAASLRAHAGSQGHRWAVQFARDFEVERHLRVETSRSLRITLLHPHLVAHYGGGGVEAIVVDGVGKQAERHRVAVVLVYQRAHGRALVDDEAPSKAKHARLELGEDWTPATSANEEVRSSRARLCAAVQQLARECITIGLSHLSSHVQQRLATLAVWAQGADLPRMARMLRRLADHVDLLLLRAGAADEHRLLDELALACGLAEAITQAATRGDPPTSLVGTARGRFHETATLALLGLGACTFRSPTGHRGLTMVLWSQEEQTFTTCSDARPSMLRGFDPVARYRQPGPWTGLGAPQQATGGMVTLTGARRDEQGRIAASERTHAVVRPATTGAFAAIPTIASWRELSHALDAALPESLLAEAQPLRQWALLRPARFEAARFDPVRQVLTWPLHDGDGAVVNAVLPWREDTRTAIRRIEGLAPSQLVGSVVVAHLRRAGAAVIAEPLSLLHPEQERPVDCLHFEAGSEPGSNVAATAGERAIEDEHEPVANGSPVEMPRPLRELRSLVQRLAERGVPATSGLTSLPSLVAAIEGCVAAGLDALPRAATGGTDGVAQLLLRVHYASMQYERLLSPAVDDEGGDAEE